MPIDGDFRIVALGALAVIAATIAGAISACAPASRDESCSQSSVAPLRVCASKQTLAGLDVSSYQGAIDWASVKGTGRAFAIARVSDGTTHVDTSFAKNWTSMKSAGLVRGTYQFFRPGQDAVAQADLVTSTLAKLGYGDGDLPAVLDLETADGLASATVVAQARAWLARVEQTTGRRPIVYTAAFMDSVIGGAFGGYVLWVANYGATCPSVPSGWTNWKIWQQSSTGAVAGIKGDVDLDTFNGPLADLVALGVTTVDAGHAPPTAPDRDAGAPSMGPIDRPRVTPLPARPAGNAMGDSTPAAVLSADDGGSGAQVSPRCR